MSTMHRISRALVATVASVALLGVGVASAGALRQPAPTQAAPTQGASNQADPNDPSAPTRSTRITQPSVQEMDFVAIKPCRIFDTRAAGGIMANATRSFRVKNNLTSQGGSAACGIPNAAAAVATNLTGISDGSGFVRAWAWGTTPSTATVLNFAPSINASNMVDIPVCTVSCTSGMTIRTFGTTHLVGDAVGYYVPKMQVVVAINGTLFNGSRAVDSDRIGPGNYRVSFDRSLAGCSAQATVFSSTGFYYALATPIGTDVGVRVWTLPDGVATPTDRAFNLSVSC